MENQEIRETMQEGKAQKKPIVQDSKNPKKLEIVGIARAFGDDKKDYYVGKDENDHYYLFAGTVMDWQIDPVWYSDDIWN